ncbi:hypothetical protein D9M69_449740 [compost metagenome]
MQVAQHGSKASDQWAVGQQHIKMERRLGYRHWEAMGGNRRVQIGQRLLIVEPGELGQHANQQVMEAIRLGNEGGQALVPVHACACLVPIEQAGGS